MPIGASVPNLRHIEYVHDHARIERMLFGATLREADAEPYRVAPEHSSRVSPARRSDVGVLDWAIRTALSRCAPTASGTAPPDEAEMPCAAGVLNAGSRVAMLVGQGACGARDELTRVGDVLGSASRRRCSTGTRTWYAWHVRFRAGTRGSLSGTLVAMGPGVPSAIGAKFGDPDAPVIALVGDGAMQMNGLNELITIAKYWRDRHGSGRCGAAAAPIVC